jgi:ADP-ribose pyrophosphatase
MEIKSEKIVHATRFLEMMTTQFTVKDSQDVREWNWCRRPKSQNAVVIIAKVKDSLVVIKEFRVPLNDYEWGLPAGLIDPGEDVKDCVKRELKEETGLELISFLREPSPIVYNSAGITNEGCSIVFVEATGTISKEHLQDEEDIETYLMSKLDVKTLMWLASNGKTKIGAKAWMAFELFLSGVI